MNLDDDILRVLQINSGSQYFGGVSSLLYNMYVNIDHSKLQFDFLSPNKTTYGIHRDEIAELGGRVLEFNITGNIFYKKIELYRRLKDFLKENPYQIVHINSGNIFFNTVAVAAVKKAGVPVRIVHSHNSQTNEGNIFMRVILKLMRRFIESKATVLFACSQSAANYMFTKKTVESGKVRIIHNGIDTKKFKRYNDTRTALRKEWGLAGKFVVGHVGRFMKEKNHDFLIDVFEKIHDIEPNAVLLLFGGGELEEQIRAKVNALGLSESVKFMGMTDEIEKAYHVMDVFILPSIHEGFPLTGVEVQTMGVPMLVSDSVSRELKITEDVSFLSLNESADVWAKKAVSMRWEVFPDNTQAIIDAGYDIGCVAKSMQDFYLNLVKA